jgi:hypothetical protein
MQYLAVGHMVNGHHKLKYGADLLRRGLLFAVTLPIKALSNEGIRLVHLSTRSLDSKIHVRKHTAQKISIQENARTR